MDKILQFESRNEKGIFAHIIGRDCGSGQFLEKTAAEYHPEVAAYIRNAQAIPGKTQILLTALGAHEFWGPNKNSDTFFEADLATPTNEYGYKTFISHGNVFKHHSNKAHLGDKIYGSIALSVYNNQYHRVELVIIIDNEKAPDVADRINAGECVDFSMGTKVKYDVCSICGNKAPTTKQYCDHLKFYLGRIYPGTNKLVYAINPKPIFFDISIVTIGADRIAKSLLKVASLGYKTTNSESDQQVVSSALLAEKQAEIEKEIPVSTSEAPCSAETIPQSLRDVLESVPELKARERSFDNDMLDGMASNHSLGNILSTMATMGMTPKPMEMQRIILIKANRPDLVDYTSKANICFDPESCEDASQKSLDSISSLMSPDNFNMDLARTLSPMMQERSYHAPFLVERITEKFASDISDESIENTIPNYVKVAANGSIGDVDARKHVGLGPLMLLAAAVYAASHKIGPAMATSGIGKVIAKYPGAAGALAIAIPALAANLLGPTTVTKNAPVDPEIETYSQAKERHFAKVANISPSNISHGLGRLMLGMPMVYMASHALQKRKNASPQHQEGGITRFVRRNPDIIAGAVALDGLLALTGRGTVGAFKKFASVPTDLIWASAMTSNEHRITAIADECIVMGCKKVLSNA